MDRFAGVWAVDEETSTSRSEGNLWRCSARRGPARHVECARAGPSLQHQWCVVPAACRGLHLDPATTNHAAPSSRNGFAFGQSNGRANPFIGTGNFALNSVSFTGVDGEGYPQFFFHCEGRAVLLGPPLGIQPTKTVEGKGQQSHYWLCCHVVATPPVTLAALKPIAARQLLHHGNTTPSSALRPGGGGCVGGERTSAAPS